MTLGAPDERPSLGDPFWVLLAVLSHSHRPAADAGCTLGGLSCSPSPPGPILSAPIGSPLLLMTALCGFLGVPGGLLPLPITQRSNHGCSQRVPPALHHPRHPSCFLPKGPFCSPSPQGPIHGSSRSPSSQVPILGPSRCSRVTCWDAPCMATLEEQIRCREMGFPGGGDMVSEDPRARPVPLPPSYVP